MTLPVLAQFALFYVLALLLIWCWGCAMLGVPSPVAGVMAIITALFIAIFLVGTR